MNSTVAITILETVANYSDSNYNLPQFSLPKVVMLTVPFSLRRNSCSLLIHVHAYKLPIWDAFVCYKLQGDSICSCTKEST